MNADLRARVRAAVDAQARANIQALIIAGHLEVCAECGAARDCLTKGCKRCHDRRLKNELRKDPDFRERDRERQNACRRRRRERIRLESRLAGASPEVVSQGKKSPVSRRTSVVPSGPG